MGYPPRRTNSYWATLNHYIRTAPNAYIRMRRAGENRRIANPTDANANNIGRWEVTYKTDIGRGGELIQTCVKPNYKCDNARKIPKAVIQI